MSLSAGPLPPRHAMFDVPHPLPHSCPPSSQAGVLEVWDLLPVSNHPFEPDGVRARPAVKLDEGDKVGLSPQ